MSVSTVVLYTGGCVRIWNYGDMNAHYTYVVHPSYDYYYNSFLFNIFCLF